MKKGDLINLIKYHYDGDEIKFNKTVKGIVDHLKYYKIDDELLNVINELYENNSLMFSASKNTQKEKNAILLPNDVAEDIKYLIKSNEKMLEGVNTILFHGKPGTGKTAIVDFFGKVLKRRIHSISFSQIANSKLGETIKNLQNVFETHNREEVIIFIDELDGIVTNRNDSNDIAEMSRLLITLMKMLDELDERTIVIGVTNLKEKIDSALLRRFKYSVDFDRYKLIDYIDIADYFITKKSLDDYRKNINEILKIYWDRISPNDIEKLCVEMSNRNKIDDSPLKSIHKLINSISDYEEALELMVKYEIPNKNIYTYLKDKYTKMEIEDYKKSYLNNISKEVK